MCSEVLCSILINFKSIIKRGSMPKQGKLSHFYSNSLFARNPHWPVMCSIQMLHFGAAPRYILRASSLCCGWLMYLIWTKSTLPFSIYILYHKQTNSAQSQLLFYMHQQQNIMVPDYFTIYEQNQRIRQPILLGDITTNTKWKYGHN